MSFFDDISDGFSDAISGINEVIDDIGNTFDGIDNITDDIGDLFRYPIEKIFSSVSSLFDFRVEIDTDLRDDLDPLIVTLFDKLQLFLKEVSYTASELMSKSKELARDLINQVLQGLSKLRDEVEKMVNNIVINVGETVKQIIQKIEYDLVQPFFKEVDRLRKALIQDIKDLIDRAANRANEILDKTDYLLTATIDTFRNDALKFIEIFQWPWDKDPCKHELNIEGVPGPQLATGELYELLKCRRFKRFDNEKELKSLKVSVIQTFYADLQDQAWHLACAARGNIAGASSALRIEAIEDWLEFGQLHLLWNQFNENMTILDAINQQIQELDNKITQFQSKSSQIESLIAKVNNLENKQPQIIVFSVSGKTHISDGDPDVLQYPTTHINFGEAWQNSSLFKIPVTGIYFFTISFVKDSLLEGGTEDDVYIILRKNLSEEIGRAWSGEAAGKRDNATYTVSLKLQKGDIIDTLAASDSTIKRHIRSYRFTGYLIAEIGN
ncbi:hypothetical protein NUACC21_62830 [Scytonema sp. NUACC21]